MKLVIASDIHGSAECCRRFLAACQKEQPEKILLLGDLLYHGARNALPEGYGTMAVADQLNQVKEQILAVQGNCDSQVDQAVLEFPIMADYCLLYDNGHTFFATHGHRYNPDTPPPLSQVDVLLNGHTHVPACREYPGFVYLNPGSVSIPKGGSQCSYLLYDNGRFYWKTLDGQVFCEYAFADAIKEDC